MCLRFWERELVWIDEGMGMGLVYWVLLPLEFSVKSFLFSMCSAIVKVYFT